MDCPDRPSPPPDDPDREHVFAPLQYARDRIAAERAEVVAERRAFDVFADRVASLSTTDGARTDPSHGGGTVVVQADGPRAELAAVRSAYRETVMDVDHYERAYGDSLIESLGAEFGPELAVAVGEGAGRVLTPQLRNALLDAAAEARDERVAFVENLDAELASIDRAAGAVEDLFCRLDGEDESADPSIERLDAIVERRQEQLNRQPLVRRTDGHDLCSYLYDAPDWTYPVLTVAATLRSAIDGRDGA